MSPKPAALTGAYIGKAVSRVDGRLKVTGAAPYAAEETMPNMAWGLIVDSPIAAGEITKIDTKLAEQSPGVLAIITHDNRGPLGKPPSSLMDGLVAEQRLPLADPKIYYAGQPIAFVVAGTLEQAQSAATLLNFTFKETIAAVTMEQAPDTYQPQQFNGEKLQMQRGDVDKALAIAEVKFDRIYETPCQHPNAMEPHAAIAWWDSSSDLSVRNSTQFAYGDRNVLSGLFQLPKEKVHIIAPYIGGMFGSKAATGAYVILSAIAARELKRPVKTVLTRQQVMTGVGYRSRTFQRFEIGSEGDGVLTAMRHTVDSQTAIQDEFAEPCSLTSRLLYKVPNYETIHNLHRVNTMNPSWMRGPGETPCQFAQESALDELAYQLNADPIRLRLRNDADLHPVLEKPFSSKHLAECFGRGAERFGWDRRNPKPRSVREGNLLIGMGTATATYPGYTMGASVLARLQRRGDDVHLVVSTAAADVGTGMYTLISLTAAEALSLPLASVTAELGDSHYPHAAVAGGSNLTSSVAPAVHQACAELRSQLCGLAVARGGPLAGVDAGALDYSDGRISHRDQPWQSVSYAGLLAFAKKDELSTTAKTEQIMGHNKRFAFQSFGAQFAEVAVDADLHTVRVRRLAGVFDAGRIMNAKAARSQMLGGMIFGLGMALLEELTFDPVYGRATNADFADYLIPVNADVPDIDVSFINEPDLEFNSLGCRGVGELGSPGMAAAIANAVFNATGVRVRDLPITIEKLQAGSRHA